MSDDTLAILDGMAVQGLINDVGALVERCAAVAKSLRAASPALADLAEEFGAHLTETQGAFYRKAYFGPDGPVMGGTPQPGRTH